MEKFTKINEDAKNLDLSKDKLVELYDKLMSKFHEVIDEIKTSDATQERLEKLVKANDALLDFVGWEFEDEAATDLRDENTI